MIEIVPTENMGEKNMLLALYNKLEEKKLFQGKNICIGSGTSGCKAFQNKPKDQYNILLTWQWLDVLSDIDDGTIIILPEHAMDDRFKNLKDNKKNIQYIEICGVLHTKTIDSVKKHQYLYEIDEDTNHIVMLGGDVQQEDGSWKYYTIEMVNKLLDGLSSDDKILFVNGPRTGRFKDNKENQNAHRSEVDHITQHVQSYIKQKRLEDKWKVSDFKYGQNSYWDDVLKFVMENSSVILSLPSETTSMISEVLTLGIKFLVYINDAMTKTSENYIKQLVTKDSIYVKVPENFSNKQEPLGDQFEIIIKQLQVLFEPQQQSWGAYIINQQMTTKLQQQQ